MRRAGAFKLKRWGFPSIFKTIPLSDVLKKPITVPRGAPTRRRDVQYIDLN
jgi:hypothetical protein